jgi:hypothetical protein
LSSGRNDEFLPLHASRRRFTAAGSDTKIGTIVVTHVERSVVRYVPELSFAPRPIT